MVNRYVGAGKFFGEKVVKPAVTAIKKTFSKKSPTITKQKPKVGSLTKRRADQDDVIRNAQKVIDKRNLTKEQKIAVRKTIAPGMKDISKTRDEIDKLKKLREKKMGGGMMGRRMGYSEGKLAVTPREKQLAAQYGDKKRITRGDVITAAKSKSGKRMQASVGGGADMTKVASDKTKKKAKKFEKRAKAASKDIKNIGRSFSSIQREKYMR